MVEDPPDALRDRAREVLSQPKFRAEEPGLVDRAWERFTDFLGDLLTAVTSGVFGSVVVGWLVLAAMLGLTVFFLVRYLPRRRPGAVEAGPAAIATQRRRRRSRAEWLEAADEATQQGRGRDAVEAWFRATVAGLVESDELPDRPDSTVSELRAAFAAPPERSDPFGAAADVFSDVWYGGAPAGPAEAARLSALDRQVLARGGRT